MDKNIRGGFYRNISTCIASCHVLSLDTHIRTLRKSRQKKTRRSRDSKLKITARMFLF